MSVIFDTAPSRGPVVWEVNHSNVGYWNSVDDDAPPSDSTPGGFPEDANYTAARAGTGTQRIFRGWTTSVAQSGLNVGQYYWDWDSFQWMTTHQSEDGYAIQEGFARFAAVVPAGSVVTDAYMEFTAHLSGVGDGAGPTGRTGGAFDAAKTDDVVVSPVEVEIRVWNWGAGSQPSAFLPGGSISSLPLAGTFVLGSTSDVLVHVDLDPSVLDLTAESKFIFAPKDLTDGTSPFQGYAPRQSGFPDNVNAYAKRVGGFVDVKLDATHKVQLFGVVEGPLDTVLAVYTGPDLTHLTEVASNDDTPFSPPGDSTSAVTIDPDPDTDYWIQVGTYYSGSQGYVVLEWGRDGSGSPYTPSGPETAPPNDAFANAIVLEGASGQTLPYTIDAATVEAGEPTPIHPGRRFQTLWFKWRQRVRAVLEGWS